MYAQSNHINPVNGKRNKIYIFVIDPSIQPDFLEKLKIYCQAFYTGMAIEIMKPEVDNFLETLGVPSRINPYTGKQWHANVILDKTVS